MKRYYLIFVFSIISGICYSQISKPVTIEITKADLKMTPSKMSEVFDEVSYIKLETKNDIIVGAATHYHLIKMKDCFCLYHSRCNEEILLFETDGRFRCKIGRIGHGPGEYSGLFTVFYDKYLNQILIMQNKKINKYDLHGNYISTIEILTKFQIRGMAIVDELHWMFSFYEPGENEKSKVGVLMTNKDGRTVKEYSDYSGSAPGFAFNLANRNKVYDSGSGVFFCPYDYNKSYQYNGGVWELAVIVGDPFTKPSKAIYNSGRNELMQFGIKNGVLMDVRINFPGVIIEGATPNSFIFLVDVQNGSKYLSSYVMDFHKEGFINDIDGGMPFYVRKICEDGYSYELIDAPTLLEYDNKGLLDSDGKKYGKSLNLDEVLQSTSATDNPIIMVAHIKYHL